MNDDRLDVPSELQYLIEKREQEERRQAERRDARDGSSTVADDPEEGAANDNSEGTPIHERRSGKDQQASRRCETRRVHDDPPE